MCLKNFSQYTRRDTVRRQLLRELTMICLERLTTMVVSFLYFWTSHRPLTLLRTKYYSHNLSVATAWMHSNISKRLQFVRVVNDCSSKHKLACGVPQGSVLGPILYSMYTAPIADVVKRQGMGFTLLFR